MSYNKFRDFEEISSNGDCSILVSNYFGSQITVTKKLIVQTETNGPDLSYLIGLNNRQFLPASRDIVQHYLLLVKVECLIIAYPLRHRRSLEHMWQ